MVLQLGGTSHVYDEDRIFVKSTSNEGKDLTDLVVYCC